MKYKHIPTGVFVHSDVELPAAVYEKVDETKATTKQPAKRTPARKTAKKEQ